MLKSKSQQGVWKMVAPDMKLDHEVLPPRPRLTTSSPHYHHLTTSPPAHQRKGGRVWWLHPTCYILNATSCTLHPTP